MKKVIIIGSRGYIGSFLANELRNSGVLVYGYDIIENRYNHPNEFICYSTDIPNHDLNQADIIIYLAGLSGRAQCEKYDYDYVYSKNVTDLLTVLKKCNKTQLFIYASTAAILEGYNEYPVNENIKVYDNMFDKYTKSMYDRENAIIYDNNIQATCIGLRFGTVIGLSPKQRFDLLHIAMLRSAFLNGKIIVNNPDTMRCILWNKDLLAAIKSIINSNKNNSNIYNLGSYNCSISKVANEIACKTGALVKYIPATETSAKGFMLNSSKFKEDYNCELLGTFENIFNDLATNFTKLIDDGNNYLNNLSCRVCKNNDLMNIIDFGTQPLANNFTKNIEKHKEYPLGLVRCRTCHHTQLSFTTPPEEMFCSYLYASGTSQTLREYFSYIADKCEEDIKTDNKTIIEIACNDGTQLDEFKKRGWRTIGVDPAENLTDIAKSKGHEIFNGFWGTTKFENLPVPDIIMGQNVLAHVPDPILFLKECYNVMNNDTILYIQTSQANMYQNGEYDTVYHEHLSFFTAHSFKKAAEEANLVIINIEKTPIHGTSFLVKMKKNKDNYNIHDKSLDLLLEEEKNIGITNDGYYIQFRHRAQNMTKWFEKNVFSKSDYKIVAYGAAAKGMTILNYMKPTNINFIVDDASLKQNTFSPGLNIPVVPTNQLSNIDDNVVIIVFAWNFINEIINKIKNLRHKINKDTLVVVPYPKQTIYRITNTDIQIILRNDIEQISINYMNDNKRPKTLLINHFYNEEFLMENWIRHHAPLFDKAILINYASTDKSLEIINREAPSSWIVVDSKNNFFEAALVDIEVAEYENNEDKHTWKIALNNTEFLLHPNFKQSLRNLPLEYIVKFPSVYMNGLDPIDNPNVKPFNPKQSIIEQRTHFGINHIFINDKNPLLTDASRFLHRGTKITYKVGRHGIEETANILWSGFIAKYAWTPWPEIKNRKLQIQNKIPDIDKQRGVGFQHIQNNDTIEQLIKNSKKLLTFSFADNESLLYKQLNIARELNIIWNNLVCII